tara:strand:+ start:162 stop:893 length:732 start_codon:yes stop_codon:yes gene_type:complete
MKQYSNLNINVIRAYLIHLLTGAGILMSFFSIISILNEDKLLTFLFLVIALFIDVIDGNLARKFNVKKFCPNVDGIMLDSIVDYINYVFIPCIIIYKFNYVPEQFVIILPILILSISLFSFSYLKIMTENYLYVGFPSIWNVIIIYLSILDLNVWNNLIILVILIILKVIPIKVIHPMRYESHKRRNSIIAIGLIFISLTLLLNTLSINFLDKFKSIFEVIWYLLNAYFIVFVIWINLNFKKN